MTKTQALQKARSIWGKTAMVEKRDTPTTTKEGTVLLDTHLVGRVELGMFFEVLGEGKTWEEAFAKVRP